MPTIRYCQVKDFPYILELLKQLWPDKKLNKQAIKDLYKRLLESKEEILLCTEIKGKVIGFCTLLIKNSFWQAGPIGNINELVVAKNLRGKSIGTDLIKTAVKIAKKKGCKKLELDSAFHRKRAHKFYKKIGFENRAFLFSKTLIK